MDDDDVIEALEEAGIDADGASMESMREALKVSWTGKEMTVREAFELLDEDRSGYLDRSELLKAAGMLGSSLRYVVDEEDLSKQFDRMDVRKNGQVSFESFESWCASTASSYIRFDRTGHTRCALVTAGPHAFLTLDPISRFGLNHT